jgi:hypothetical protein
MLAQFGTGNVTLLRPWPVTNGTGMKCKLGEAALAGKAVITTRLGAIGYPPELRKGFVVIDNTQSLDKQTVINAIEAVPSETRRHLFEPVSRFPSTRQARSEPVRHGRRTCRA